MKPQRQFFIPKGAIKVTPRDVNAVIYMGRDRQERYYAMAFSGNRQRYDFYYSFASQARMEKSIREYLDALRASTNYKREQIAKRKGFKHGYKVDDILHYSWGYEQTNCEFYQVISTTPGTVTIREIAQEAEPDSMLAHGMAENRVAVKDRFLEKSEPIVKRVQYSESGPGYVSMPHGCCSLWDGRPRYCSWYA